MATTALLLVKNAIASRDDTTHAGSHLILVNKTPVLVSQNNMLPLSNWQKVMKTNASVSACIAMKKFQRYMELRIISEQIWDAA